MHQAQPIVAATAMTARSLSSRSIWGGFSEMRAMPGPSLPRDASTPFRQRRPPKCDIRARGRQARGGLQTAPTCLKTTVAAARCVAGADVLHGHELEDLDGKPALALGQEGVPVG